MVTKVGISTEFMRTGLLFVPRVFAGCVVCAHFFLNLSQAFSTTIKGILHLAACYLCPVSTIPITTTIILN